VISGASQVCPYQSVTYSISTGGIFYNNFMDVTASGGVITSIDFKPWFRKSIYNNGANAWVDSGSDEMGDGTVTVLWGSGGPGMIRANVRYNIGIFGGQQWNSDEISVSNGLGALGNISGSVAISCGVSTSSYSISPVFGADSYTWSSSSPNLQVINNGDNSATFDVSNFRGGANITVIARNNTCNVTGIKTLYVYRVPATGRVSGQAEVCSNTEAYYSALDQSSYAPLLGSNFVWFLPSGWSITSGDGTGDISVQVPYYYATTPSFVTLSYQALDGCGSVVRGSMSIKKMPNGNCYMERVIPPTDEEKEPKDEIVAFSLYPNPSQEQVTLSCGTKESGTLKIYDKFGTEVVYFANVSNGFVFSVARFVTDTYSVQFVTQDTVKTFRLVVNHN
jgi:hypothetical protein